MKTEASASPEEPIRGIAEFLRSLPCLTQAIPAGVAPPGPAEPEPRPRESTPSSGPTGPASIGAPVASELDQLAPEPVVLKEEASAAGLRRPLPHRPLLCRLWPNSGARQFKTMPGPTYHRGPNPEAPSGPSRWCGPRRPRTIAGSRAPRSPISRDRRRSQPERGAAVLPVPARCQPLGPGPAHRRQRGQRASC